MEEKGYCQCGCGGKTSINEYNNKNKGLVKGEPRLFLKAHQLRKVVTTPTGYEIDEETGCWNWMLSKDDRGYGKTQLNGKSTHAHIAHWVRIHGPVGSGLELDHLCRNVGCVNPAHLEPVTPTENKRRSRATKLTSEQVVLIKRSNESHGVLAIRFGITASNISQIRRGFSWKDIS